MAEERATDHLIVRWVPLLTMNVGWEAAWRHAMMSMNSHATPIREFSDKQDVESHIHFLAYEAQWHKKIAKENHIGESLLLRPPSADSRMVLVSCDQAAFPKVSEKSVQNLANECMASVGKQRHIIRAQTAEILRREVENLVLQSLLEHGMTLPPDQQLATGRYLEEGVGEWDATGI